MALVPKARTLFLAGLLGGSLVLAVSLVARAEPAVATYYGEEYVGTPTASGQLYDPNDYTAAHPYLPFGTELLVSHNGQSVIVTVNDSCFCGLDLSLAAAQALERVMNPRRGCRSLAGGRGKRRRQSAASPKWPAASHDPSLAVEIAMPMRNPTPPPSGAPRAREAPLRLFVLNHFQPHAMSLRFRSWPLSGISLVHVC
jgi:hypothetical protein